MESHENDEGSNPPRGEIRADLSQYSSADYNPGPLLKRVAWYLVSLLLFETKLPWSSTLKAAILEAFGARVGGGLVLKPKIRIKYPWFLELGDHVWIGESVWIDNLAPVTIGSHVVVSQGAYLLTGNHDYRSVTFDLRLEPIEVEDGAWIAAKSVIAPGVRVAKGVVIGLGAVVTSDTEPEAVYSGNPAAKVRNRFR